LAPVAARQKLIVQSVDLARLALRELTRGSRFATSRLVFDPALNRPVAPMNRRRILGARRLREKWRRSNQREDNERFV